MLDLFMNRITKYSSLFLVLATLIFGVYYFGTRTSLSSEFSPGQEIDALNGIPIYFNGGVNETHGRNFDPNGYNTGLRFQCVEFVKRYYLEKLGHQMPDQFGHAKSFFNLELADGALNEKRGLMQYRNGSNISPEPDDIVVFGPSIFNPYGHVAIIAEVNPYAIIIAQQNAGPFASSREALPLINQGQNFRVTNSRVLGWLRMPDKSNNNSFKADSLRERP